MDWTPWATWNCAPHIETQTGVRVTPKTIVTYNTARTLAGHLTETLSARQAD